jgi:hypothetical protein
MSASRLLETLGVAAVVVGRDDGQLIDCAGVVDQAATIASATAAVAAELGHLGAMLHLDSRDPFMFVVRGVTRARVVCRQRKKIAIVDVDPKRRTADIELHLWTADSWAKDESVAAVPVLVPAPLPVPLPAPQPVAVDPGAETPKPKFAGDLHLFGLADLMEFLRAGNRSGTLVCTSDSGTGIVHLRRGKIIDATSPTAMSIAAFFAQRGTFPPDELRTLVANPADFSDPVIARVLLERSLVTLDDVRDALMTRIVTAVRDLVTWSHGRFEFDTQAAVEGAVPGVDIEIDSQALLLSIFANEDERSRAL